MSNIEDPLIEKIGKWLGRYVDPTTPDGKNYQEIVAAFKQMRAEIEDLKKQNETAVHFHPDKMLEPKEHYVSTALQHVIDERKRQDAKWGAQNHDLMAWNGILTEETGELAHEIVEAWSWQDKQPENSKQFLVNARAEAIQVAAVAVAFVECLDRGAWKWSERKS